MPNATSIDRMSYVAVRKVRLSSVEAASAAIAALNERPSLTGPGGPPLLVSFKHHCFPELHWNCRRQPLLWHVTMSQLLLEQPACAHAAARAAGTVTVAVSMMQCLSTQPCP